MQTKTSLREEPYYNYYVQEPMTEFWKQHRHKDQNVLFICGLGFDPRCTPALKAMVSVIDNGSSFTTMCARFTNCMDSNFANHEESLECLDIIRNAANSVKNGYRHEIEVNLFDNEERQIGDEMLIREFDEAVGTELLRYTDIVVDVSAFPRSMMYTLIGHLWKYRKKGQNLFAVLTQTPESGIATAEKFVDTSYIKGDRRYYNQKGDQVWVPIISDDILRMDAIYDFLKPIEVFPLVPFPDSDLRKGDYLLTHNRDIIFGKWQVPFENIMYASGNVPWDVFRKLSDFAELHASTRHTSSLVISALAGRAISIGALVAALKHELYICHVQPADYSMSQDIRKRIFSECENIEPTLYWLAGDLYD